MPRYDKPTKICHDCGKELPTEAFERHRVRGKNGNIYDKIRNVCRECRRRAERGRYVPRPRPRRPCAVCGKPAAKVNGDYCSSECKEMARKARYKYKPAEATNRACSVCGKSFLAKGKTRICSPPCRHERARERGRGRMAANRATMSPEGKAAERFRIKQVKRARNAKTRSPNTVKLAEWEQIQTTFGGMCAYCDTPMAKPDMDHFVPLALGGKNTKYNVVPACAPCNGKKRAKEPRAWINDEDRYQFICDTVGSL